MRVHVIGQKDNEPVRQRTVTPREFFEAWGGYAEAMFRSRPRPLYVTAAGHDYKVAVVVVE